MLDPAFSSIGALSFGPGGVLFAADNQAATIFAIDLGALASGTTPGTKDVPALDQKIAAMVGTDAGERGHHRSRGAPDVEELVRRNQTR